jgi:phenylalanyl-tRNA synthetase alpha chain
MKDRINELRAKFTDALALADDGAAVEALRVEYLGKKGFVAELMKGLRDAADKKEAGQLINSLKVFLEEKLEERKGELHSLEISKRVREAKKYNPSLRFEEQLGSYHPITLASREVEEVFVSMGFTI